MRILLVTHQAGIRSTTNNRLLLPDLEAAGHRVIRLDHHALVPIFGHEGAQRAVVSCVRTYRPHVVICNPPYDMLATATCRDIRALGVPLVGWRYDDGMHLASWSTPALRAREWQRAAAKYTLSATTCREAFRDMTAHGVTQAAYLRLAASPGAFIGTDRLPEVAVSFMGRPYLEVDDRRRNVLCQLAAAGVDLTLWGHGWDAVPELVPFWRGYCPNERMAAAFRASAINLTIDGWTQPMIKSRLLEVVIAGGFQLVDAADELDDYFAAGSEIVATRSVPDLVGKIAHFLRHPAERAAIAAAARARALRDHTWHARWLELVALLGSVTGQAPSEDDAPDWIDPDQVDTASLTMLTLAHLAEAAANRDPASCHREMADYYFDEALRLRPNDYGALSGKARLAEMAGMPQVAIGNWLSAKDRFEIFGMSWPSAPHVAGLTGEGGLAPREPRLEAVQRLLQLIRREGSFHLLAGMATDIAGVSLETAEATAAALMTRGQFGVVRRIYEAVLADDPTRHVAAVGLANALHSLGFTTEAVAVLDTLLAGKPEHVNAALLRETWLGADR